MLAPAEFQKLLMYRPESGLLFWTGVPPEGLSKPWYWHRNHPAGSAAFTATDRKGYLVGEVKGRRYFAHRLAWAVYYGEWPRYIDHINGDRKDNRIWNLRSVEMSENTRNRAMMTNNKSGVMGVAWSAASQKWQASIGGKYLGLFTSLEDAAAARKSAEASLGFHPNHGRSRAHA